MAAPSQGSPITTHCAGCFEEPHRQSLALPEYTFSVSYKSGRLHQDADCLSRHPVDPPDHTGRDCDSGVLTISDLLTIGDHQCCDPSL